ncbi:MAG TPA: hypothetical protein VMD53_07570 [Rhizomicrobium sp.]|nr:hypothetical protein [Rhizomicrobium sp.]
MRVKTWISASVFVAAGLLPAGASADQQNIRWSGAGWYFETLGGVALFAGGSDLLAGPYPSKAACEAANPRADASGCNYFCADEASDPNSDKSQ